MAETVFGRGDHPRTARVGVLIGQGKTVGNACKALGVTDKSSYQSRQRRGSLRIDQAKRMRALEAENERLKQAAAELISDTTIQKEIVVGNVRSRCGGGHRRIS